VVHEGCLPVVKLPLDGRKETQFMYLQLLRSSVPTPKNAQRPTTTC